MRGFEALRNLCIQPEALLGGCCGGPKASFRLKNTLPSSLKSLTFYGDEGLVLIQGLGEQLCEILFSGDFPHLKSVVLENISKIVPMYIPSYVSLPHQVVKEACRKIGVSFQELKGRRFLKGDKQLPYFVQARRRRLRRELRRGQ